MRSGGDQRNYSETVKIQEIRESEDGKLVWKAVQQDQVLSEVGLQRFLMLNLFLIIKINWRFVTAEEESKHKCIRKAGIGLNIVEFDQGETI